MFVQALQQSNYNKYKYKLNDGMSNVTKNISGIVLTCRKLKMHYGVLESYTKQCGNRRNTAKNNM